jgi:hypothetical protein
LFFWGDITDLWGGYHGLFAFVDNFVDKISLGGISRTFGGDITDLWGGYHGPLGGISRTRACQTYLGNTGFLSNFLPLKLY